jgi:hypothetical protein
MPHTIDLPLTDALEDSLITVHYAVKSWGLPSTGSDLVAWGDAWFDHNNRKMNSALDNLGIPIGKCAF